MCKSSKPSRRRRGFTLVEVMLVLAILVIIGSIVTVNLVQAWRNAQIDAARAQVKVFKTPLLNYRMDIGDFPSTSDGLQALRTIPSGLSNPSKWRGPYLDSEVPPDPWGNLYRYEYPGKYQTDLPDIWSVGPDGMDSSEDDIGNWPTVKE
ncbi:MAG: type II secretion system major pseudopilin GspG [Pirellulales bacterium]|nr:type II secretion system major pseudopilin GspG [Pirellulales bacterium]